MKKLLLWLMDFFSKKKRFEKPPMEFELRMWERKGNKWEEIQIDPDVKLEIHDSRK